MREFLDNVKAALWELVIPTLPVDDDQSPADQAATRAAWLRDHRGPSDGGAA
jgi:hypothetical protein